ncbi:MAG TPA: tetratricopeptide repeat protein [Parafilimonas sp.]|nr:tetratricopeptide repeat protein [Parafilimonas sp.]
MKTAKLSALLLLVCLAWNCSEKKSTGSEQAAGLFDNMGHLNHPVTTNSETAQKLFNQGMTLMYGFNHEEAVRSFEQALKNDSTMAMAWWGIAFCYGSNYNWPADMNATHKAYDAITKAQALSAHVSQKEKDYINTLAVRYTNDSTADLPALERKYSARMKALSEKYPDDLDAKTLYAESMMNLHPWELWTKDGQPNENTLDIVKALKEVLAIDSNHIGANHYLIHAMEASPHPEEALPSARRLATLVPNAGHLVHMPAHIYMRTGNYAGADHANDTARHVDSAYIAKNHVAGIYPMLYYTHNLHFLAIAQCFEGRYAAAKKSLDACEQQVPPDMVKQMPMIQFLTAAPMQLIVGSENWEEALNHPKPDSSMNITVALWHWARGLAYLNKHDMANAAAEQKQFKQIAHSLPSDQTYGYTPVSVIATIADAIFSAKMSEQKKDLKAAENFYKQAVVEEKKTHYDEPPDWFLPTSNMLGGFYLRNGKNAEAEAAFRDALKEFPNNGKALFGLQEALKAQGKNDEAQKVKTDFDVAWKNADKPLSVQDL